MRLISLLLLSVLLSVFVGLAVPFSAASAGGDAGCCTGEPGHENEEGGTSPPCSTAECPCGFCLPAVLPGAVDLLSPDSPAHSSPQINPLLRLTAFPDGIDYPPERLSL